MTSSAWLLVPPAAAVLASRLALHARGQCRNRLEAIATGVLFYFFLLAPPLLLGVAPRSWMQLYVGVVMLAIAVCEGIQTFLALQFGMVIDPTLHAMVAMTSGSEIRDFIRTIFNPQLVAVVLGGLALVAADAALPSLAGGLATCRWAGYAALGLFLAKGVESVLKRRSYHAHRQRTFIQIIQKHNAMLQLVLSGLEYRQRFHRLREASRRTPPSGLVTPAVPEGLLGIVVIGESACRGHHGLYGYGRPTTPGLERLLAGHPGNAAVFDDAIAAIPTTPEAFEFMFTCLTVDREEFKPRLTLPALLKQAGFWQAFYGAQPRFSRADTSQTLIFSACDESVNLNQASGNERDTARSVYDEALLPRVWPHFDRKPAHPTALFLNLYGSHLLYRNRYPEDWPAPFADDDRQGLPPSLDDKFVREWNEYDNSVAYTDSVLTRLAERVMRESSRPCFLLYFSDHGEVLSDGVRLQRSRKSREHDAYEIPLVMVWNDRYAEALPDVVAAADANRHCPLQMDKFLPSFCQAFGLNWAQKGESALASGFEPPERRTMDLGEVVYERGTIP